MSTQHGSRKNNPEWEPSRSKSGRKSWRKRIKNFFGLQDNIRDMRDVKKDFASPEEHSAPSKRKNIQQQNTYTNNNIVNKNSPVSDASKSNSTHNVASHEKSTNNKNIPDESSKQKPTEKKKETWEEFQARLAEEYKEYDKEMERRKKYGKEDPWDNLKRAREDDEYIDDYDVFLKKEDEKYEKWRKEKTDPWDNSPGGRIRKLDKNIITDISKYPMVPDKNSKYYGMPESMIGKTGLSERSLQKRLDREKREKERSHGGNKEIKQEFEKYTKQNYTGTVHKLTDADKYIKPGKRRVSLLFSDILDTIDDINAESNEFRIRPDMNTVVGVGDIITYDTDYGTAIAKITDVDDYAAVMLIGEVQIKVSVIDKIIDR